MTLFTTICDLTHPYHGCHKVTHLCRLLRCVKQVRFPLCHSVLCITWLTSISCSLAFIHLPLSIILLQFLYLSCSPLFYSETSFFRLYINFMERNLTGKKCIIYHNTGSEYSSQIPVITHSLPATQCRKNHW